MPDQCMQFDMQLNTLRPRRMRRVLQLAVWMWLGLAANGAVLSSPVAIRERIEAQAAIERVYHSHRIGNSLSFEDAVPREILENRVRTYLRQSRALEEVWHTRVTAEMLRGELNRIARNTRYPARLLEIYDALGQDPVLILECFVRPVLVDRLARRFLVGDRILQAPAREEIERLRKALVRGDLDPRDDNPRRLLQIIQHGTGDVNHLEGRPDGVGQPGPILERGDAFEFSVVLERYEEGERSVSYRVPKIHWDTWWSKTQDRFDAASVESTEPLGMPLPLPVGASSLECGPDNVWDNGAALIQPAETREYHTAIWTGSEMIVWGGHVFQSGSSASP